MTTPFIELSPSGAACVRCLHLVVKTARVHEGARNTDQDELYARRIQCVDSLLKGAAYSCRQIIFRGRVDRCGTLLDVR